MGVGCYRIDLHPRVSGAGYLDLGCWPFQIPLGALIPVRVENLLPGGKNLGVTHITNGAYRVHPVEWNVGEAAGLLAAFCLERKSSRRGRPEPPGRCSKSSRHCCGGRASSSPGQAHTLCEVLMESTDAIRIGISGSYGGMNLGDEAILEGILGQLRATRPGGHHRLLPNPEDTLARHRSSGPSPAPLTRREMVPEIEQLDLFVLGGGGILYDRDAAEYLREVFIANELGVPVMLYAISAGPLDDARPPGGPCGAR